MKHLSGGCGPNRARKLHINVSLLQPLLQPPHPHTAAATVLQRYGFGAVEVMGVSFAELCLSFLLGLAALPQHASLLSTHAQRSHETHETRHSRQGPFQHHLETPLTRDTVT